MAPAGLLEQDALLAADASWAGTATFKAARPTLPAAGLALLQELDTASSKDQDGKPRARVRFNVKGRRPGPHYGSPDIIPPAETPLKLPAQLAPLLTLAFRSPERQTLRAARGFSSADCSPEPLPKPFPPSIQPLPQAASRPGAGKQAPARSKSAPPNSRPVWGSRAVSPGRAASAGGAATRRPAAATTQQAAPAEKSAAQSSALAQQPPGGACASKRQQQQEDGLTATALAEGQRVSGRSRARTALFGPVAAAHCHEAGAPHTAAAASGPQAPAAQGVPVASSSAAAAAAAAEPEALTPGFDTVHALLASLRLPPLALSPDSSSGPSPHQQAQAQMSPTDAVVAQSGSPACRQRSLAATEPGSPEPSSPSASPSSAAGHGSFTIPQLSVDQAFAVLGIYPPSSSCSSSTTDAAAAAGGASPAAPQGGGHSGGACGLPLLRLRALRVIMSAKRAAQLQAQGQLAARLAAALKAVRLGKALITAIHVGITPDDMRSSRERQLMAALQQHSRQLRRLRLQHALLLLKQHCDWRQDLGLLMQQMQRTQAEAMLIACWQAWRQEAGGVRQQAVQGAAVRVHQLYARRLLTASLAHWRLLQLQGRMRRLGRQAVDSHWQVLLQWRVLRRWLLHMRRCATIKARAAGLAADPAVQDSTLRYLQASAHQAAAPGRQRRLLQYRQQLEAASDEAEHLQRHLRFAVMRAQQQQHDRSSVAPACAGGPQPGGQPLLLGQWQRKRELQGLIEALSKHQCGVAEQLAASGVASLPDLADCTAAARERWESSSAALAAHELAHAERQRQSGQLREGVRQLQERLSTLLFDVHCVQQAERVCEQRRASAVAAVEEARQSSQAALDGLGAAQQQSDASALALAQAKEAECAARQQLLAAQQQLSQAECVGSKLAHHLRSLQQQQRHQQQQQGPPAWPAAMGKTSPSRAASNPATVVAFMRGTSPKKLGGSSNEQESAVAAPPPGSLAARVQTTQAQLREVQSLLVTAQRRVERHGAEAAAAAEGVAAAQQAADAHLAGVQSAAQALAAAGAAVQASVAAVHEAETQLEAQQEAQRALLRQQEQAGRELEALQAGQQEAQRALRRAPQERQLLLEQLQDCEQRALELSLALQRALHHGKLVCGLLAAVGQFPAPLVQAVVAQSGAQAQLGPTGYEHLVEAAIAAEATDMSARAGSFASLANFRALLSDLVGTGASSSSCSSSCCSSAHASAHASPSPAAAPGWAPKGAALALQGQQPRERGPPSSATSSSPARSFTFSPWQASPPSRPGRHSPTAVVQQQSPASDAASPGGAPQPAAAVTPTRASSCVLQKEAGSPSPLSSPAPNVAAAMVQFHCRGLARRCLRALQLHLALGRRQAAAADALLARWQQRRVLLGLRHASALMAARASRHARRLLLAKALAGWRAWARRKLLHWVSLEAAARYKRLRVLCHWRALAVRRAAQRQRLQQYQPRHDYWLLRRCLGWWSRTAHATALLTRVLSAASRAWAEAARLDSGILLYSSDFRLLHDAFFGWRTQHRLRVAERQQRAAEQAADAFWRAAALLRGWRAFQSCLDAARLRQQLHTLRGCAFLAWRAVARVAAKDRYSRVAIRRRLRRLGRPNECQLHNSRLLRRGFAAMAGHILLAVRHRQCVLKARALAAWIEAATSTQMKRSYLRQRWGVTVPLTKALAAWRALVRARRRRRKRAGEALAWREQLLRLKVLRVLAAHCSLKRSLRCSSSAASGAYSSIVVPLPGAQAQVPGSQAAGPEELPRWVPSEGAQAAEARGGSVEEQQAAGVARLGVEAGDLTDEEVLQLLRSHPLLPGAAGGAASNPAAAPQRTVRQAAGKGRAKSAPRQRPNSRSLAGSGAAGIKPAAAAWAGTNMPVADTCASRARRRSSTGAAAADQAVAAQLAGWRTRAFYC